MQVIRYRHLRQGGAKHSGRGRFFFLGGGRAKGKCRHLGQGGVKRSGKEGQGKQGIRYRHLRQGGLSTQSKQGGAKHSGQFFSFLGEGFLFSSS